MRITILMIFATVVIGLTGCAGTRSVKQVDNDPPKRMTAPILSRQEKASRDMQSTPAELAKTQVEGALVR